MMRFPWIVASAAVAACGAPETAQTERNPTQADRPAAAAPPASRPEWVGIVTARKSKIIPAPFQGRVNQVLVHASQVVKEGDVIAKFDEGELKRKLKGAIADQKASSAAGGRYAAEARAASHELSMNQKLFNRGFAARNDIMNARTKLDSAGAGGGEAAARAEQAEATVDDIKSKLSHSDDKVPFDGVISVVKVKEGEVA